MKKALAISLLLNAALMATLCWKELAAHAAGGGGAPAGNGDVNGDGKVNIADAIYII